MKDEFQGFMFAQSKPFRGMIDLIIGLKRKYTLKTAVESTNIWNSLPKPKDKTDYLNQEMLGKLIEHKNHIRVNGMDMPEARNWKWKN